MTTLLALAELPQRTIGEWHRFVETANPDLLVPVLSPSIVLRSPFVHAPLRGPQLTLLVLGTIAQIFENFRYHREFVASPHDVALEFSANIGKWELPISVNGN